MFDELIKQIVQLVGVKTTIIVAISGFGGAGKSHLTDRLRDYFKLKDAQIVRVDHLYSKNPDGPGIFDQTDWDLLNKILADVRAGKQLQYQGKGSKGEPILVDEELPKVVLVEGIRLLQPTLMPYFDLSVWIDCPQGIALERAKARDRGQGEDEETVSRWDTDWGPKDKAYFDMYRPDKIASFIYKNSTF